MLNGAFKKWLKNKTTYLINKEIWELTGEDVIDISFVKSEYKGMSFLSSLPLLTLRYKLYKRFSWLEFTEDNPINYEPFLSLCRDIHDNPEKCIFRDGDEFRYKSVLFKTVGGTVIEIDSRIAVTENLLYLNKRQCKILYDLIGKGVIIKKDLSIQSHKEALCKEYGVK